MVTIMKNEMIKVDNVSVRFNLCKEQYNGLKEYIIKIIKGELLFEEFWALKDVSFVVEKGDVLGILGLNGAGKSTLLKTISGDTLACSISGASSSPPQSWSDLQEAHSAPPPPFGF